MTLPLRLALVGFLALGCDGGPEDVDAGGGGMDAAVRDAGSDAAESDAAEGDGAATDRDTGRPDAGVEVPSCAVFAELTEEALQAPAAGSDGYVPPGEGVRAALSDALDAVAGGQVDVALARAEAASYDLCRGEGDEADLWLLAPADRTVGWARIVLRVGAARPLQLHVPHPFFDSNTLPEGVAMMRALSARALVVSGTDRCGSDAPACDGTGTACGAYTVSDPAHSTVGAFHAAHVALSALYEEDVVVSLHGFRQDGVRISDGTQRDTTAGSVLARLAGALVDAGLEGVTACNPGAGVDVVSDYCGTTNVQGRHLNGSPAPCSERATAATGRFLHLEQASVVRGSFVDLVIEGFERAVPR